jgi:hypothetical protein
MHTVTIDPGRPLAVTLDFQSVHMTAFRLRARRPDGSWETFALGTQEDEMRPHSVGPLPGGSTLDYRFLYTSDKKSTFRAVITIRQEGESCAGGIIPIAGDENDSGLEGQITLEQP